LESNNSTPNYKKLIADVMSRHYNVLDECKNNTIEENRQFCENQSFPFAVGTVNVLGDLNVGIMIRTASLLGAEEFIIFGRARYDRRSTVGAENYIKMTFAGGDSADIFEHLKNTKYHPVIVEHGGLELPFSFAEWTLLTENKTPLFIFGSEGDGFSQEFLNDPQMTYPIISLPQRGVLRSYNVSSAMGIVVYDYVRELL